MSARSKARKRALDVLFEADQRGRDPLSTLQDWTDRNDPPIPAYADVLVRGVAEHAPRIDEVLASYTTDWPVDRLPSVDRAVLRLATFELLWSAEVPAAVAIGRYRMAPSRVTVQPGTGSAAEVTAAITRPSRSRVAVCSWSSRCRSKACSPASGASAGSTQVAACHSSGGSGRRFQACLYRSTASR